MGLTPHKIYAKIWVMVNEQQDDESRGAKDEQSFAVETFTPRVKELLLAQPMNPIRIMTFTKLPRQPKAGKVCPSYNSNNDDVALAGDTQPSEVPISFSQPQAGPHKRIISLESLTGSTLSVQ